MRTPLTSIAAAVVLVAAAACTAHPRAGTGDVAFRLEWRGISDLDLVVVDPNGECVFFGNRRSASGGWLDVDCNAGAQPCPRPIENVFWPARTAPAGSYRVWVHAHSLLPAEAPLRYELQILRGTSSVFRREGVLRDHDELHGPFVHDYPDGRIAALAAAEPLPPSCTAQRFVQPPGGDDTAP